MTESGGGPFSSFFSFFFFPLRCLSYAFSPSGRPVDPHKSYYIFFWFVVFAVVGLLLLCCFVALDTNGNRDEDRE